MLVTGGSRGIGRAIAQALPRARAAVAVLSGRFISVYDDLDQLIASAADLQHRDLHALKVDRLASGTPNPALAEIMAASRKVAD